MNPINGRQPIALRDKIAYWIASFGMLFASREYRVFNSLITTYGAQEIDSRLLGNKDLTP